MARKKHIGSVKYGIDDEALAAAEAKLAIDYVEGHLFDPLTVARVAKACHVSAYHFSRNFSRRKGESLMSYVRGRRLDIAAQRLRDEPNAPIVDIALDCRFESHATFTRAFTRAFGMSPIEYRRTKSPRGRKWRSTIMTPVLQASIERIETFHVAGLTGRYDPSTFIRINELWKAFGAKKGFPGQLGNGETCGVFRERNFTTQGFEHLAGARIAAGHKPEGLQVWTLPGRDYLVVKQSLVEGELHPQVAATQAEIWTQLVPNAGRTLARAPDFQIYPANFKVGPGGWIAYYIPLQ